MPLKLARSAVDRIQEATLLGRLVRDVGGYSGNRVDRMDPLGWAKQGLATREERFLDMAEHAIYATRHGPLRALLSHAGCEMGDLRGLVRDEGVEGALSMLAARGVYVTFEEAKGRRPIQRGSFELHARGSDFDNPLYRPHMLLVTSGSGGRPDRAYRSLRAMVETGRMFKLCAAELGLRPTEFGLWWPMPISVMLTMAVSGIAPTGWFYPVHPLPWRARVWAMAVRALLRIRGVELPSPRRCDLDAPGAVLEWLGDRARRPGEAVMQVMPSAAARLAIEAEARGQRLDGVTLLLSGEPITAARRAIVESSGARVMAMYSSVEFSVLASECVARDESDDMHALTNCFAYVERARPAGPDGASGPRVDALMVTPLDRFAGKIMLNAETGDYATLRRRTCDCPMSSVGLDLHVSGVRSFAKLTSEGVTFVRSPLEELVEREFPVRFGGTSIDYQLAEEEVGAGVTRLVVRVAPGVGPVDAAVLRGMLLEALAGQGPTSAYHAAIWRSAETIEIRRETPRATRAGKVLPLQPLSDKGR